MLSKGYKYWGLLVFVVLLMITLTACDLGTTPAVEEHDVNISVVENDEGAIEDAVVKLENSRTYDDTTNQYGRVVFRNVREDSYDLTATKEGWVAVEGVGTVLIDSEKFFRIKMAEAPYFEIEIIDYQTEVTTLGEEVEIRVEVKNTGSVSGEVYIDLFENKFVEEGYEIFKSVVLEPGEIETLVLRYEPQEKLGIAKFIIKSFNDRTGLYDDSDFVWGVVLEEDSFAVGFDRFEGDTDNFGDEKNQFLDFLTNIELDEEKVDEYKIVIENQDQYYELRHLEDILEFRFRSNNWFDIVVVTDGGDISEAVDGLDNGYISNITELRVTDAQIWVNDELIDVPDEEVKIVEWSPFDEKLDSTGLSVSSERFNIQR